MYSNNFQFKMRLRIGSYRAQILLLILFSLAILMILNKWFRCDKTNTLKLLDYSDHFDTIEPSYEINYDYEPCNQTAVSQCEPSTAILCNINNEYNVNCRREGRHIFVPFSFLSRYFEIKGYTNSNVFEWHHSEGNIYKPKKAYSVSGPYSSFEYFNVEGRSRVLCISGQYGVPVSTQWKPEGYFYPIQIAQFGLSHYSKMVVHRESNKRHFFVEFLDPFRWKSRGRKNMVSKDSKEGIGDILSFKTDSSSEKDSYLWFDALLLPQSFYTFKLSLNLNSFSNFRLTIVTDSHTLHYVNNDVAIYSIARTNNHLETTYGIGGVAKIKLKSKEADDNIEEVNGKDEADDLSASSKTVDESKQRENKIEKTFELSSNGLKTVYESVKNWRTLLRDLNVDALKGFQKWKMRNGGKKLNRAIKFKPIKRLIRVELRGDGQLSNFSLGSSDHEGFFFETVRWVIENQDDRGGWSIPVERKLANGKLNLKAGWYSAMAQGHCISLLSRAYLLTKNKLYINAAKSALKLFQKSSDKGGVRAIFPGNFPWFEEYPTVPSSFVLNGFIYSLIGILDLKMVLAGEGDTENIVSVLYEEGITSLKKLLPLFDTGSGSMYDLRHFSLPEMSPNLARWEYHTTHINLLYLLGTIETNSIVFNATADRWVGYMKGHRASHN